LCLACLIAVVELGLMLESIELGVLLVLLVLLMLTESQVREEPEELAQVEVAYPVVAPMAAVCEMVLAFWVC